MILVILGSLIPLIAGLLEAWIKNGPDRRRREIDKVLADGDLAILSGRLDELNNKLRRKKNNSPPG